MCVHSFRVFCLRNSSIFPEVRGKLAWRLDGAAVAAGLRLGKSNAERCADHSIGRAGVSHWLELVLQVSAG